MEDVPLVGSLSRACYAPCEGECTRSDIGGSVPIRGIKRTMADAYYRKHGEPEYGPPEERKGKRIAIVGSGPSGLTAAYHLGRQGYDVTIFEAEKVAGGMLRLAIPEFRLPGHIVDRDIKNITALGVEIKTSYTVSSLLKLKDEGFDAVYVAAGAKEPRYMGIEGEELTGVIDCMTFLEQVNCGDAKDLTGKTVVVVGGGNSAMDPARSAIRLGAKEVHIMYRRSMGEMPAHDFEIKSAQEEGVQLKLLTNPVRFMGTNGKLNSLECISMELGEADQSGRRRPVPVEGSEAILNPDLVVLAIGLSPTTTNFGTELDLNKNGTVKSDKRTLLTGIDSVFAGGDVATGPSMIVDACGQGRRAAFFIDKHLSGANLDKEVFFMDEERQQADKQKVLANVSDMSERPAMELSELPASEAVKSFAATEHTMSKAEAQYGASRCLDCGECCKCGECVKACPAFAIDLNAKGRTEKYKATSIIVATGFDLFDAAKKPLLKFKELSNVVTSMQMDRMLAPTRPYNALMRPSDGKVPKNVAFVLCTGSRDHKAGNRLCSRVCCMYSIKQAQLVMGSLPMGEVTIYYIDIRAFGKGFDEFYEQSKDMDVEYVKGKVAAIEDGTDGSVIVTYEDFAEGKGLVKREHDLVVLSVGMLANQEYKELFPQLDLDADDYKFVKEVSENLHPGKTNIEGVFVAGTAAGSRDIPDTILHSGAAASQAAVYVVQRRKK
jgi:heterodisulfide reductase subunit A